jgi:D-3-phosphoglycerate dehydrogenase / 2-oxoglutarate reductase
MDKQIFVIDFDSTFIQVEALVELASISLKDRSNKKEVLKEIEAITEQGVEEKISFSESLKKRIELLVANKTHLDFLIRRLKRKISVSITRNKEFIKSHSKNIYIISGGFKEFIIPIVGQFYIQPENVFANTFEFDEKGNIVGFDEENILAHNNGKVSLLKTMNLEGDIYVIGDGYTDFQIKKAGLANKFYAFTENIERESILDKADYVTPSFDEFLYLNKLPMVISYPKNRINVLLLENVDPNAFRIFNEEGYNVQIQKSELAENELLERINDVSILGIRSKTLITEKILHNANRLIAIGAFCIGTDQIDSIMCSNKGIAVFNAPYSNTRSVVEMVLGEIIVLMRNIYQQSNKLKQGIWEKTVSGNYEIRGKKLGIVGYGNIGSQLSVLAEMLGLDVYYYDIVEKLALGNASLCKSLDELLRKVDIVTIHVDGRPENKNLISDKQFRLMKNGAIFLNASRGCIVDIKSFVKALKSGKIKGAAVDVFPEEPKNNSTDFYSELQRFPNVIMTPHVGGSTIEAQKNIADFVSDKIIKYVNTGSSFYSVNFPNLQLPELKKAHRLIHIHKNRPGLLAQINSVLANRNINIVGQYLKTNEEIGYVITDIAREYDEEVIKELRKIPNTIKFRVLY